MISYTTKGSFKDTTAYLSRMSKNDPYQQLESFAKQGVAALSAATPKESGTTASMWRYEIKNDGKSVTISWHNDHFVDGVPIAIILQYGHGTGTGGWVEGRDYINPAIRPQMDAIAGKVWKAVTS